MSRGLKTGDWPSHGQDTVVLPVTQDERRRIVQALADGVSREGIAQRMGVRYDTVMRVATAHGYPSRQRLIAAALELAAQVPASRPSPGVVEAADIAEPDEGVTTDRVSDRVRRGLPQAAVIRAWARENGVDVPARGAISSAVLDEYEDAHPIGAPTTQEAS